MWASDDDCLPNRAGRQHANCEEEIVDGCRHASFNSHNNRELQRVFEEALLEERQAHWNMSNVVYLEFGLYPKFSHPACQTTHSARGITKLTDAKTHRARIQRSHPRS